MTTLGPKWEALLSDLERGFDLLRRLPPAVTFFGGARIAPEDPYYAVSREIGRLFARAGIPPRTGAGPGIMTSVPEGFQAGLKERKPGSTGAYLRALVEGFDAAAGEAPAAPAPLHRATLTQGIKILLPFEPEVNESIDVGVELSTFPIRRLMLYENSLGLVVFPGGLGTLDELYEVWSRRVHPRHRDPIVLVGEAFFGPIVAAMRRTLVDGPRRTVDPALIDEVLLTDDPALVVRTITGSKGLIGFDEDPAVIARRLATEIPFVAGALRMARPALTLLGGSPLDADDPVLRVAADVVRDLAARGATVRVGTCGPPCRTALAAFEAEGARARLQGFFLAGERDGEPSEWAGRGGCVTVSDPIAHKLLLTEHCTGFLALPGDLRTLNEVFSVLCEIQTGKMPPRPVVLVGADFWGPILDASRKVMLTPERSTISPGDLELATVVDRADDALAALRRHPPGD